MSEAFLALLEGRACGVLESDLSFALRLLGVGPVICKPNGLIFADLRDERKDTETCE